MTPLETLQLALKTLFESKPETEQLAADGMGSAIADYIAPGGSGHNRLHALNSILDHTSDVAEGYLFEADEHGLPIGSTLTASGVVAALSAIASKANDNAVVHLASVETMTRTKVIDVSDTDAIPLVLKGSHSAGTVGVINGLDPSANIGWSFQRNSVEYAKIVVGGDGHLHVQDGSGHDLFLGIGAMAEDVGAEPEGSIATHAALTTGVHGVGASSVASTSYVDGAIATALAIMTNRLGPGVQAVSDLRALDGASQTDKEARLVEDTGALWRYDAQATGSDDGVFVVVPHDITPPSPGRWLKGTGAAQDHNTLLNLNVGDYHHLTAAEYTYLPSSGQKDALAGTDTPSGSNKFVTANWLTWAHLDKTVSSLADLATRNHHDLANFDAADDHAQYAKVAGRTGGQTLYGGTATGETLVLHGNAYDAAHMSPVGHVTIGGATRSVDIDGMRVSYQGTLVPANHLLVTDGSNVVTSVLGPGTQGSYWAKCVRDSLGNLTVSWSALAGGDVGLGNVTNDAQVKRTEMGAASGVATLDVGGRLSSSQIPAISIVENLGSVASQAAMLALTGQKGDWCQRSDLGTAWVITGSDPTQLSSWTQWNYPTAPVTSVNTKTGTVTLGYGDVGAAAASHASQHNAGGSDALAIDAAAGTGSFRTLGTGATQAAAGNHGHSALASGLAVGKVRIYDDHLEINENVGGGDRVSYVDFHSSDAGDNDYEMRLIRAAGINGTTTLNTRGTGGLVLQTEQAGSISLRTANVERVNIGSAGNVLVKSVQSTNPQNLVLNGYLADGTVDAMCNTVRCRFDTNADFSTYWKTWRGANGSVYRGILGFQQVTDLDVLIWDSTGKVAIPGLNASQVVATDASKNLVNIAYSTTGGANTIAQADANGSLTAAGSAGYRSLILNQAGTASTQAASLLQVSLASGAAVSQWIGTAINVDTAGYMAWCNHTTAASRYLSIGIGGQDPAVPGSSSIELTRTAVRFNVTPVFAGVTASRALATDSSKGVVTLNATTSTAFGGVTMTNAGQTYTGPSIVPAAGNWLALWSCHTFLPGVGYTFSYLDYGGTTIDNGDQPWTANTARTLKTWGRALFTADGVKTLSVLAVSNVAGVTMYGVGASQIILIPQPG